jgi:hypothetical protein
MKGLHPLWGRCPKEEEEKKKMGIGPEGGNEDREQYKNDSWEGEGLEEVERGREKSQRLWIRARSAELRSDWLC